MHVKIPIRDTVSVIIGCVVIYTICDAVNNTVRTLIFSTIFSIVLATAGYFAILLFMKNHTALNIWFEIKRRIKLEIHDTKKKKMR